MKSRKNLKMGYDGSKTSSLGKILVKCCARSRGLIFSPILTKPGQNIYLDKLSEELNMGYVDKKLGH